MKRNTLKEMGKAAQHFLIKTLPKQLHLDMVPKGP